MLILYNREKDFAAAFSNIVEQGKNHSTLSWFGIKDRIINSCRAGEGGESYPFENRKSLLAEMVEICGKYTVLKRPFSPGKRSEYIMNAIRYGVGVFHPPQLF